MKVQILIIVYLTSFVVNTQKFTGTATYKSFRKSQFKIDSTTAARNPKMQEMIQAKLRKMNQHTYKLSFTQSESNYKQLPKLDSPNPKASQGGVMVMSFGGGGNDLLYKNIKKKSYTDKVELMSKPFLVKDKLPDYDWKLTGKTKTIGTYTVYQATWTREEENISMTVNNEKTEEKVSKEMRTTTVWYTPEIPINNGPDNWWGLPGLILEVNDGNLTLVCTEIILNPKEKVEIKIPKKGKVVSQEKFEKISREKSKEMMNRFKSRRGNQMQIRIGG